MNNMNFRRQTNCPNCGNCRQQTQKAEPNCRCGNPIIEPRIENTDYNKQNIYHHDCSCNTDKIRPHENCTEAISHIDMHNIPIGIGYVPLQKWRNIYALCEGLSQGTIFKELSYPFYGCIPNGFFSNKGGAK